jgi:hypothetical protein
MKTWYLIVRHEPIQQVFYENGIDIGPTEYPVEGFAITGYDDKERAELNAKSWGNNYKVVPVCKYEEK